LVVRQGLARPPSLPPTAAKGYLRLFAREAGMNYLSPASPVL
jgi:hypothetical protein